MGLKIIMWSVLSGDFDQRILPEKSLENVLRNSQSGSIVVFHDSEKAWKRLAYALPKVLEYYTEKGYSFKKINL
jgi:peptidoglycan/xylan/chitin deacetylase (PgdA/CDA1 family)